MCLGVNDGVTHLRELFDLRNREVDKALELQAKEIERRLENLNHEAERIAKSNEDHVSRDVYNQEVGQMRAELDRLRLNQATRDGKTVGISLVCSAIISVLGLLIALVALRR
jgi:hypothetical protein